MESQTVRSGRETDKASQTLENVKRARGRDSSSRPPYWRSGVQYWATARTAPEVKVADGG